VKLKLDENLPLRLVGVLAALGHDVDTIPEEHVAGRDDGTVWDATQAAGRFLITQDLDFSDARKYVPGTHHGLLLLRFDQPGREASFERVRTIFTIEDVESWKGALVSVSARKVRVKQEK
jgi:predicted nuclease of predicted toxin-antitoxin system